MITYLCILICIFKMGGTCIPAIIRKAHTIENTKALTPVNKTALLLSNNNCRNKNLNVQKLKQEFYSIPVIY